MHKKKRMVGLKFFSWMVSPKLDTQEQVRQGGMRIEVEEGFWGLESQSKQFKKISH